MKNSVHLCLLHTNEKFTESVTVAPNGRAPLSTPWFRGYGLINPIVCTDSFPQSSLNDVTAVQHPDFSSVAQSCLTLYDPMNRSTPGLPVHTNSRSLPKPMSIELMMPFSHLILCHPLLLLPSIFPSIRIFSNESALCIRWPKYWSSASISQTSARENQKAH